MQKSIEYQIENAHGVWTENSDDRWVGLLRYFHLSILTTHFYVYHCLTCFCLPKRFRIRKYSYLSKFDIVASKSSLLYIILTISVISNSRKIRNPLLSSKTSSPLSLLVVTFRIGNRFTKFMNS